MFRAGGEFVTITFGTDGRITGRGLGYGQLWQVARDLCNEATAKAYELGGAIIVNPELSPDNVSEVVRDALALKLPYSLTKSLGLYERQLWSRGA